VNDPNKQAEFEETLVRTVWIAFMVAAWSLIDFP